MLRIDGLESGKGHFRWCYWFAVGQKSLQRFYRRTIRVFGVSPLCSTQGAKQMRASRMNRKTQSRKRWHENGVLFVKVNVGFRTDSVRTGCSLTKLNAERNEEPLMLDTQAVISSGLLGSLALVQNHQQTNVSAEEGGRNVRLLNFRHPTANRFLVMSRRWFCFRFSNSRKPTGCRVAKRTGS